MRGLLIASSEFTDMTPKTDDSWNMTGPPADIKYADDPIGVETMTPSLLSCQTSLPFTRSVCSISVALLDENAAISLRAGCASLPSILTPSRGTLSTSKSPRFSLRV